MDFIEFEKKMNSIGVSTLAEIARFLNTTPQAVSNWKSRNHVPHHIALKIHIDDKSTVSSQSPKIINENKEDTINISDILLRMAEQLKVIIFVPLIFFFLAFTYIQFISKPIYKSEATFLMQGSSTANQASSLPTAFGFGFQSSGPEDLSSVDLIPEILKSRMYSKILLVREFETTKFNQKLPLIVILSNGMKTASIKNDTLTAKAMESLNEMIKFDKDPSNQFNTLSVLSDEPKFSKLLADAALQELEKVNKYFKNQASEEKIKFIKNRIKSVQTDLEYSEQLLKEFREKNRQILSPALMLDQERLSRDVEIQKGLFITIRQQLELAKIEEVGKSSIFQILDRPMIPTARHGKNLASKLIYSLIIGTFFGLLLAFIKSAIQSNNIDERKKIRKIRNFLKKKSKEIMLDRRVTGTLIFLLFLCSPLYFGHKSNNPVFFGRYSTLYLIINILYILAIIFSLSFYFYSKRNKH